jgi:hypothetical protein
LTFDHRGDWNGVIAPVKAKALARLTPPRNRGDWELSNLQSESGGSCPIFIEKNTMFHQ